MSRILVVEDEPAIALALQTDLRLEGYEVEVAEDGETASQRARDEPFDLILLDIMLPGKDGFAVCREVRSAGVKVPILMLTAKAQEAEKVLGSYFCMVNAACILAVLNVLRGKRIDSWDPQRDSTLPLPGALAGAARKPPLA